MDEDSSSAGSLGEGATRGHDIGIDAVACIIDIPMDLAQAVREAGELVAGSWQRMMRLVVLGAVSPDRASL